MTPQVSCYSTPRVSGMLRPGCRTTCLCIEKRRSLQPIFFSIASIIKLNKPTFTPSKHSKWKVNTNYPSTNGHWRTAHGKKMMEKGSSGIE